MICGVVDEYVESAGERLGDAGARVGGGHVEQQHAPADPFGDPAGVLLGLRHVEDDDLGAVPGQGRGDGLADAPRGAGDQGGAAGQGRSASSGAGLSWSPTAITWPLT